MHKKDNLLLIGFSLLTLMLLISANMLFFNHYGFHSAELYAHYHGSPDRFIQAKSFIGILKSFSPHIIAMPLVFFILFHLAISAKLFNQKETKYIAIVGFSSALGDISVNFLMPYAIFFAYVKFLFFIAFELALTYIIVSFFRRIYL